MTVFTPLLFISEATRLGLLKKI
ncbi:protein of unknown function [Streptococcus thermophilus]|nr:protein of unknown function [Streptococcus thermophilus]CAD0155381.1 protein of unknown function [Streptococcus thermophilus]CAD0167253.1 protein of unknown function [Streptococcus thermophilus]CAD0169756.1 protein of unknown function [Streptococcus thermophilus]CAD0180162.1 protein of unknown function [Streptococcus thermophilus]